MTSKYERGIEEIERARAEEGRIWSQRNPENLQYGIGAVAGYGEPFWAQTRAALPFQVQTPQIGQISTHHSLPVTGMFQTPFAGQQQGMLQGHAPSAYSPQLTHPQFHPYTASAQQPYLYPNPFLFSAPMMHPYGQQQFYPQMQVPLESQWPGQSQGWENISQRSPFLRQPVRAFNRPPRNFKRSDELIRDEICKRLAFTSEIDVTDVDVIVKDGEVTLKGVVDDRVTKRMVEDIAETSFGVRDVLNDLKVGSRLIEQELYGTTKGKEK